MKILLCADSICSADAQIHMYLLAVGLDRLGHQVFFASPPSSLSDKLPLSVTFLPLPCFGKSLPKLIRSYFAVRRITHRYNFDVVHAQAGLSALICKKAGRKHQNFTVTVSEPPIPRITRFVSCGNKIIALNNIIKVRLTRHFFVMPENVFVIKKGINTFDITPCEKPFCNNILFVGNCSATAVLLCRLAGRLTAKFGKISITLVGCGIDYEHILTLAEAINTACGSVIIKVINKTEDILGLMYTADIFIGTARSALEAAACGLPVILSGGEGYGGILDCNSWLDAEKSDFRVKNEKNPCLERLFEDISKLLCMSVEDRKALCRYGRAQVCRLHSAEWMARRAVEVYRSV